MRSVSFEMDEKTFNETEKILSAVNKNKDSYLNEAVELYNSIQRRKLLAKTLATESALVQEESMKVLEEFESLSNDD